MPILPVPANAAVFQDVGSIACISALRTNGSPVGVLGFSLKFITLLTVLYSTLSRSDVSAAMRDLSGPSTWARSSSPDKSSLAAVVAFGTYIQVNVLGTPGFFAESPLGPHVQWELTFITSVVAVLDSRLYSPLP